MQQEIIPYNSKVWYPAVYNTTANDVELTPGVLMSSLTTFKKGAGFDNSSDNCLTMKVQSGNDVYLYRTNCAETHPYFCVRPSGSCVSAARHKFTLTGVHCEFIKVHSRYRT